MCIVIVVISVYACNGGWPDQEAGEDLESFLRRKDELSMLDRHFLGIESSCTSPWMRSCDG